MNIIARQDAIEPVRYKDGSIYRQLKMDDLEQVLDIERKSFLSPWTPDIFIAELYQKQSRRRVIIDNDGKLASYVIFWIVVDESHIMNIAVDPEKLRRGFGMKTMQQAILESKSSGCTIMSLEVRANNNAAIEMYDDLGFDAVGRRKNYYKDEGQDAILMTLAL